MKHVFLFGIFGWFLSFTLVAQTGIWQWSVPVRNFSIHPIMDLILRMGHGKLWMVFWQILLKYLDIKSCLQLL